MFRNHMRRIVLAVLLVLALAGCEEMTKAGGASRDPGAGSALCGGLPYTEAMSPPAWLHGTWHLADYPSTGLTFRFGEGTVEYWQKSEAGDSPVVSVLGCGFGNELSSADGYSYEQVGAGTTITHAHTKVSDGVMDYLQTARPSPFEGYEPDTARFVRE